MANRAVVGRLVQASLLVMVACTSGRNPEAANIAPIPEGKAAPTETSSPAGHAPFEPKTFREDGHIVMPVWFPDGTSAEIRYPPELDLAGMGVQPDVAYLWVDDPPPRYQLVFVHGHADEIYFRATEPERVITTNRGDRVGLWVAAKPPPVHLLQTYWLVLPLPSWTVLASVVEAERAQSVADALTVRQDENGFPSIATRPPLDLSAESGEGEGPRLTIGDADPDPNSLLIDEHSRSVMLWVESCHPGGELSPSGKYAHRCLDGTLTADIYGDRSFVEAVYAGIEARAVKVSG